MQVFDKQDKLFVIKVLLWPFSLTVDLDQIEKQQKVDEVI